MPREYVKNPYVGVDTCTGAEVQLNTFQVSVGWSRENGSVQVGTINPESEDFCVKHGLYVELDRTSINDLIRLLRKARDQAFGRDE